MRFSHLLCLAAVAAAPFSQANSELLGETQKAAAQEASHNQNRESAFALTEAQAAKKLAKLKARRAALETETNALSATFSENEHKLAGLEEKLRLETGSLGELFGVVRQGAKELKLELDDSVTRIDRQQHRETVAEIAQAKTLPSLSQLQQMWLALQEQIDASAEIAAVDVPYVGGDGVRQTMSGVRLGAFGLIGDQGYLEWNPASELARPYLVQPVNAPTASALVAGSGQVALDPSRGQLISQLALTPDLKERIAQGGVVGKIILALLAGGLLIVLVRGASLLRTRAQVFAQIKSESVLENNPLGRVMAAAEKVRSQSAEALEMRLLESIVDEQQGLEKGLSMLKLMAALAPMLGLLGTVTGMIETFQTITQFGNGDPKIMAGGISMALVTTVLGLVAAMPLLIGHNLLSGQAEAIRLILEKQGIALVAARLDSEPESESFPVKQERVA